MSSPLLLAIDQGTGSTKALLVDAASRIVARGQCAIGLATPKAGWVEQDATEIWNSVLSAIKATVTAETAGQVASIGLATQRESCVIWDRRTGEPMTPLLSWQDQRTLGLCDAVSENDRTLIRAKTGLPLDPMFSAVKAQWLLDQIDADRVKARAGDICIGTIDSFLLFRLGAGHVIEIGNASRTQLLDLSTGRFDDGLLSLFNVPAEALPRVVSSSGEFVRTRGIAPLPDGVPVTAVLADSHSALFAHGAYEPGKVKATQGTGSSVMGLYDSHVSPESIDLGVCRTIAWQIDATAYAFEGNIRSAGSTLVWLAEVLNTDAETLANLAAQVDDSGGVAIVPAFGGLGSPYWDADAVGLLGGIVLGTSRAQIARAALDSIGHQIADVLGRVRLSGLPVERLYVDGGPTKNDRLMQFEADMTATPVHRPVTAELSALGAAHLAGLTSGVWSFDDLRKLERPGTVFEPGVDAGSHEHARSEWRKMVARSRGQAVGKITHPSSGTIAGKTA